MPDLLRTQGALSLQVCGIDGMAQPAALRAHGRGSRSVQKRFLCGEEISHPGKYLRRMRGAGLWKQSAAMQASATFATAAVAAAVAVQCAPRGAPSMPGNGAPFATLRDALLHALCRIALHQAAPGVVVALRRGEARCPDAIASQITHSIDRREGHHGATVIDSNELSVAAHSIYLLKSLLALTGQ
jgi:hypothetical protein